MKTEQIEITSAHVQMAIKEWGDVCETCPVAQALLESKPGVRWRVNRHTIHIAGVSQYRPSPALTDEIIRFDRTGQFNPGTYEIISLRSSERGGMDVE